VNTISQLYKCLQNFMEDRDMNQDMVSRLGPGGGLVRLWRRFGDAHDPVRPLYGTEPSLCPL
jgi:hypothetical protein